MTDAAPTAALLPLFMQYARASGAQVQVVTTLAEAAGVVSALAPAGLKCVAAVRDRYPALYAALAATDQPVLLAEALATQAPSRTALATALAGGPGLVVAAAGVAETGSLLLADDALAPRLLSMLADVCIAVLPVAAILPDLDAAGTLLARLDAAGQRYLSLVTGPSRTADIERVLTIGVQGPKALHIVVLLGEDGVLSTEY